jgi:hypothetical protein
MAAIEHLLALSEGYIAATSIEAKTLSWRVFGDSKKLDALRGGKDIQVRRYEAAMAWFSANWPVHAIWPELTPGMPISEPTGEEVA